MISKEELELKRIFKEFDCPLTSTDYATDIPGIVRKAAVLLLLRWCDTECCWKILLTIRSQIVSTHQGEVAFPGGMRDKEDHSPVETALREAYEEVGVPYSYVHVIGTAPPFRTRFNFALYPVIGVLDSNVTYQPFPNEEVSACFWVRLDRFLSTSGYSVRQFTVKDVSFSTNVFEDVVECCDEPVITWGITAFIAIVAAMITYQRKPEYAFPAMWTLRGSKFHASTDLDWSQVVHAILDHAISVIPPAPPVRPAKL
uniref:Nudix hydrolase domain-containing protein n=1 Tax=Plectus sambesii TaxID=2011161 RepID=A0A914W3Z9_9BILA